MTAWGLDLGTSNSVIARWDDTRAAPALMVLPALADDDDASRALGPTPGVAIPSAVEFRPPPPPLRRALDRLAPGPPTPRAIVGGPARLRSAGARRPAYVSRFKPWLDRAPTAALCRAHDRVYTPRDAARAWLAGVLYRAAQDGFGRPRPLALAVPVRATEGYRAELARLARDLRVGPVRFVDEPVAAALGYGLTLDRPRRVLVLDIGAGTMDAAVVDLSPRGAEQGRAVVRAKAGRALGGDHVDAWVIAHLLGQEPRPGAFWTDPLLDEARRVKEAAVRHGRATLHVLPPERLPDPDRAAPVPQAESTLTGEALAALLARRGWPDAIRDLLGQLARTTDLDTVTDVLTTGGAIPLPTTLQPLADRFGAQRLRTWRPRHAVALGAATFAAGQVAPDDVLVHDYSLRTLDPTTGAPRHTPLLSAGTPLPTASRAWTRRLVPACAHGEPEHTFRLDVCELTPGPPDPRLHGPEATGEPVAGRDDLYAVPLTPEPAALGHLDPPHLPGDRRPRLEVSFAVDADRWLVATVVDLHTGRTLRRREPVVRLL